MVDITQNQLPPSIDHINQLPTNCSTPYMSSTSKPMFNFFYSAPTSPHSPKFHSYDLNDDDHDSEHVSLLDHDHHQKPMNDDDQKDDFEFDFSGQLDLMVRPSLSSADELFDGGKIRPLKLKLNPTVVPKEVMSPKHRKMGSDLGPDLDPFKDLIRDNGSKQRGRNSGNGVNRKGLSRSLSPLRVSEFALLGNQDPQNLNGYGSSNSNGLFGSGKWRLKDLFLFRSASEGHNKDSQYFSKRWSFRSSSMVSGSGSGLGSGSGSGSESGSVSKRRGRVSAHEMHYASKRAVCEERKKKTSLPYKHGLLACLGFSPVLPQFSYAFPNTPP